MADPGNGKKLLVYLPVVLVAAAGAAAWGAQQSKVTDNVERIQKLERAIIEQGKASAVLEERTKETQKDVLEIKGDVKSLLEGLLQKNRRQD